MEIIVDKIEETNDIDSTEPATDIEVLCGEFGNVCLSNL